jgi:uncharacterized membrane protein
MSAALEQKARREKTILIGSWLALAGISGLWLWIFLRENHPPNANLIWGQALGLASIPGKYVIFTGLAPGSPLGPFGLMLLAISVDTLLAITLCLALGPLSKLRYVGPWLERAHGRANRLLTEYPRLKREAFIGVVLFVFLPLPGAGSVGGTFVSQLLGLSRPMGVLAIAIGTTAIVGFFTVLALTLGSRAQDMLENPWISGISVLVLGGAIWLLYRRFRESLRRP